MSHHNFGDVHKKKIIGMKTIIEFFESEVLVNLDLLSIVKVVNQFKGNNKKPVRVCFVFDLDSSGKFKKLIKVLLVGAKIKFLYVLLFRSQGYVRKTYGIYPAVNNPVAIFQLNTLAEDYALVNVVQCNESKLGSLVKFVFRAVVNINPLLGGVAILIRKDSNVRN